MIGALVRQSGTQRTTTSRAGRLVNHRCRRNGMTTSDVNPGERVLDVRVHEATLAVDLADGRTIIAPLGWFPRLARATPAERANWQLAGGGFGIHWPDLDEDLSSASLLHGAPAAASRSGAT